MGGGAGGGGCREWERGCGFVRSAAANHDLQNLIFYVKTHANHCKSLQIRLQIKVQVVDICKSFANHDLHSDLHFANHDLQSANHPKVPPANGNVPPNSLQMDPQKVQRFMKDRCLGPLGAHEAPI